MVNIVYLDTIDSTNNWCRSHSDELPIAVVAAEQTAGRGRYGRSFYSPAGSGVYMSYAFPASYDANDVQLLTLVAAAAVHRVLQRHCSDSLSIKWVNDIYRGSRKIAGILCERVDSANGSGDYYIIVGVGVNVLPCAVPTELDSIIGFLTDNAGNELTPSSLAPEIVAALDEAFSVCMSNTKSPCTRRTVTDDMADYINYYKNNCFNLPEDIVI